MLNRCEFTNCDEHSIQVVHNFKYLSKELPTTLRLRFHQGPCPPTLSHHPRRVAQKEGRAGETKAPREYAVLDHGAELGALPRHPDCAGGGPAGKLHL